MNNVFFTSDPHYFHDAILRFGRGRSFSSIEEMNARLIDNWNSVVGKGDQTYLLGDTSFGTPEETWEVLRQLNGTIHWLLGNHDWNHKKMARIYENEWNRKIQSISEYKEIRINGQKIVLMHFPLLEWNGAHRGAWMLHGHQHGNGKPTAVPRIDVGVDCFDFTPVSFEEIEAIMQNRSWESESHH